MNHPCSVPLLVAIAFLILASASAQEDTGPAPDVEDIRLRQAPGVGPLVATAISASIGNGAAFRKGREFAPWMGMVPGQHLTGGKAKLYGISKRGNRDLRKILSMALAPWCCDPSENASRWGPWVTSLEI
jgi:transposase